MQSEQAVLGGGCFWCLEAAYQQIEGVSEAEPGYAGGNWPNPTYDRVCSGTTGHAEVVRVSFNPAVISYSDILDIFWVIHNPTTLNSQDFDKGTEYRSIILYTDDHQKTLAQASKADIQKLWEEPVVTEIVPLEKFWPAEPEHKDYFKNNPERAYCQIIINPKLDKLKQHFAKRLKTQL
jgi:peptide-methionine (S)-S-oxide reductase